jgi:hypothetical protein
MSKPLQNHIQKRITCYIETNPKELNRDKKEEAADWLKSEIFILKPCRVNIQMDLKPDLISQIKDQNFPNIIEQNANFDKMEPFKYVFKCAAFNRSQLEESLSNYIDFNPMNPGRQDNQKVIFLNLVSQILNADLMLDHLTYYNASFSYQSDIDATLKHSTAHTLRENEKFRNVMMLYYIGMIAATLISDKKNKLNLCMKNNFQQWWDENRVNIYTNIDTEDGHKRISEISLDSLPDFTPHDNIDTALDPLPHSTYIFINSVYNASQQDQKETQTSWKTCIAALLVIAVILILMVIYNKAKTSSKL